MTHFGIPSGKSESARAPAATGDVSWSTDAVDPGQRIEAWQRHLAGAFAECEMDYDTVGDFRVAMNHRRFGDIGIGRLAGSKRRAIRGEQQAKNSPDGVVLTIPLQGRYGYSQSRHEELLGQGDGFFFHNCLPGSIVATEGSECWLISLPARAIRPAFGESTSLIGCKVSQARPSLELLCNYLQAVYQTSGRWDDATREIVGRQVTDLVISSVDRQPDDIQSSAAMGLRAVRFRLALDEIARRFAEPMLNSERLAKGLGISTRYIQQLFEENDTTVSACIMGARLEAARKLLADRAQTLRTITDIVYACGFSDISHFNRSFRSKYGETPSTVRALH